MGSGVSKFWKCFSNSNAKTQQDVDGISNTQLSLKDASSRSIQDEAHSLRSKTSTVKMLIKNKNSRKAFYNFLEETEKGKEELLDYFLFIESIKRVKDDEIEASRKKFITVIAQYKRKSSGKASDLPCTVIYNSTQTWKDVRILSTTDLIKMMSLSQNEVLVAITPLFESFLLSNFYTESNINEAALERKSYASSIPIN